MAGVPPAKTLVAGLDFPTRYAIAAINEESSGDEALRAIKSRLSVLRNLDALIHITLIDGETYVLDARGKTASFERISEATDETPDATLCIKPQYIIDFCQGKLDPRYALFKDAFFHPAMMPQGDIGVATRFADLLTPNPPTPIVKYDPDEFPRLPQQTEEIEQIISDITEFGYGFLKNALDPEQVQILRKAVLEQAVGERKAGVEKRDGGPGTPNTRIWVLTNKGDEFLDLLNHPIIDAVLPKFLGEHAHIHSYFANIVRPGNQPMQIHNDQLAIQPPNRNVAYGMNIMWLLSDTSAATGGTRIYPRSHLGNVAPKNIFSIDGSVAAEAPAGTALIFESRLWHATGPYTETTGERPAILMFFMRSFIRQQENNGLSLRKDVEPKLSDRHKRLLGFYTTGALGGIDGEVREGIFVSRNDNCVGRMREPVEEDE